MTTTLAEDLVSILEERAGTGEPLYTPRQRADVLAVALLILRPRNVGDAALTVLGEFAERTGASHATNEAERAAAINTYLARHPVPETLRHGLNRFFAAAKAHNDPQRAARAFQRFLGEARARHH